jgi:hypothetical protein
MLVTIKDRETLTGVVTIESDPFDVSGMSLVTLMLTVYAISGTTPQLMIVMQSSADLETWTTVGSSFNVITAESKLASILASQGCQRYVRAQIALSGTLPLVSYSLWANLFPET